MGRLGFESRMTLSPKDSYLYGSTQVTIQRSSGINRLNHEANNSSIYNNGVKNEWSSTYMHSSRVQANISLTMRGKPPKLVLLT
jgi:hypothetical protein